jgi:hypothetical protein
MPRHLDAVIREPYHKHVKSQKLCSCPVSQRDCRPEISSATANVVQQYLSTAVVWGSLDHFFQDDCDAYGRIGLGCSRQPREIRLTWSRMCSESHVVTPGALVSFAERRYT